GALAGQWFSDFLGVKGMRLVRFDPEQKRLSDRKWTGAIEAENAFADGFPLLVVSTASLAELNRRLVAAGHAAVTMARFRPNLVLDGLTHPHDEDMIDTLRIDAPEGPVVLKPVKPCVRCSIPDIEPATAERGQTVAQTLAGYRADARMKGGLTFGMNAVIVSGVDHTLAVGARVRASL
ncbi:MAG: MOSC domain-containing protein, partial [Rubrivivax sp.]